jgi:hypothetical protein
VWIRVHSWSKTWAGLLEIEEVKLRVRGKLDDTQWAARKEGFRGRSINPLWNERCVGASSVLDRLNKPRYWHAAFRQVKRKAKTVVEIVEKAFRYQGKERLPGAMPREKTRSQSLNDRHLLENRFDGARVRA